MINDDINNDNANNYATTTSYNLPSDQSDDEEMEVNNNNNNTNAPPASSRPATRAEVLSHFEEHANGYKCKLCHKVNLLVNSYEYICLYIYITVEIAKTFIIYIPFFSHCSSSDIEMIVLALYYDKKEFSTPNYIAIRIVVYSTMPIRVSYIEQLSARILPSKAHES
jgi:hypothetical protein